MGDSIADRFIMTMARINELSTTGTDDPMRFAVRSMRQSAERVLDDAIRSAWTIADNAHNMREDATKAIAEAAAPTKQAEGDAA